MPRAVVFSLDLLVTRLKISPEDPSQFAGLVSVWTALRGFLVPEVRAKLSVICCISHGRSPSVEELSFSQSLVHSYAIFDQRS
jgi:hypothetical protein